jgi:hypothetical protein
MVLLKIISVPYMYMLITEVFIFFIENKSDIDRLSQPNKGELMRNPTFKMKYLSIYLLLLITPHAMIYIYQWRI